MADVPPRIVAGGAMAGFAVLDLETTGIHTGYHHRMVEVVVVQLDDRLQVQGIWCTLLDPRRDLGDSTEIHGLRSSDLAGAPTFEEVAGDLFDAMAGRRLVAHNASFDLGFFAYETNRADLGGGRRSRSARPSGRPRARDLKPRYVN
jgi:DNA polymerase-3 subunit epsilon